MAGYHSYSSHRHPAHSTVSRGIGGTIAVPDMDTSGDTPPRMQHVPMLRLGAAAQDPNVSASSGMVGMEDSVAFRSPSRAHPTED